MARYLQLIPANPITLFVICTSIKSNLHVPTNRTLGANHQWLCYALLLPQMLRNAST